MKCPYCGNADTSVVDSRDAEGDEKTRRRRECKKCEKRFTTYEEAAMELFVIKKSGRREPFDRKKIKTGIDHACFKRPVAEEKIDAVVDEVERELRSRDLSEVASRDIGEVVMDKLRGVDDVAYINFASVYRQFRDLTQLEREIKALKVVREDADNEAKDSTDFMQLIVESPTAGTAQPWDRTRITDALVKETGLAQAEADDISLAVERRLAGSGMKSISVSLLRELVNNELFERGHKRKLSKQEILGIAVYNLNQLIFAKSNENSNIMANNPEAVNLAIAETVLKQYALKEVFSREVGEAHLNGVLYLHDLGYIVRTYCSGHSPEYIKKYGLLLPNLASHSSPAKHAATLTGHLNTFLASMQANYAGALGLAYLNIFYAPLFRGAPYDEIKQHAQHLIFAFSQNAFSRGSQTLFIDCNLHFGIPDYLREVPAIGPGGKYIWRHGNGSLEKIDDVPRDAQSRLVQPSEGRILTYADYEGEAQQFMRALLEIAKKGDSEGKPFAFPKLNCHVDAETFRDAKQNELLRFACEVSAANGSPYFVFDREAATLSQCCRLKTKIEDPWLLNHPESIRFCGFQNVTINLPQAAYRAAQASEKVGAKPTVESVIREVEWAMDLAMKAHVQKRKFIQKIMSGPGTPLWTVAAPAADGLPYLDLDKASYIIGMIGLNECVKMICGEAMHESDAAFRVGVRVIAGMYLKAKALEAENKLKVVLEETPAESASLRLARIDLQKYPEYAKPLVRGSIETGEVYYTNSIHLQADAPVDIIERIEKQAVFNNLIEAGCITHVFLGEQQPSAESIYALVKRTWENTQSAQIVVSPEFTVCNDCGSVSRGFGRESEAQAQSAQGKAAAPAQAAAPVQAKGEAQAKAETLKGDIVFEKIAR
ncbi:MAG: transcriptional regulator NrdR [Candidatus Micrarchaeota archaeon]